MVAITATNSFLPTPGAVVNARPAQSPALDNRQAPLVQPQPQTQGQPQAQPKPEQSSPQVNNRSLISTDLTLALQGNDNGGGEEEDITLNANSKSNEDSINLAQLNEEEQARVEELRARDREVRAHERAHAASGAGIAGQPSFTFERGPDGVQYAVEGEVAIDTSEVPGDTEASIAKLEQVLRAATAPAEPSGQDRAVAAQAQARLAQLRAEALSERQAEQSSAANTDDSAEDAGNAPTTNDIGAVPQPAQTSANQAANEIVSLLGAI